MVQEDLGAVNYALITTCTNYLSVLYLGLSLKTTYKLYLILNAAAHLLIISKCWEHLTLILQALVLLLIQFEL